MSGALVPGDRSTGPLPKASRARFDWLARRLRWEKHESDADRASGGGSSGASDELASGSRQIDVVTVGELIQVARYFRGAMEQRRSIGLRAFFAATGFDLLLTKGVLDYPQLRSPAGLMLVRIGIAVGLLLYVGLVVNIERVNWHGRESYKTVEDDLRLRLGSPEPKNGFYREQTGWQAFQASWSSFWPALAAVGAGIACIWFLSTL